jgi:hypothetical protein
VRCGSVLLSLIFVQIGTMKALHRSESDMFGLLRRFRAAPAIDNNQDLMLRFCSLGYNCEFGIAQRAYDAEPLDLLRWAATPYPVLLTLLQRRFAGIGDPSAIKIDATTYGAMVKHTGYDFAWHAFAAPGMTEAEIHAREVKRLPFLARKLIEDFENASRIFVLKGATKADAQRVLDLMDNFGGKPTLLYVNDSAPVSIERAAVRLLSGHIPEFSDHRHVDTTTRSEEWLSLCRLALSQVPAG